MNAGFWQGRRVLVTGHTGFKGVWLSLWLELLGAEVVGYALPPESVPSMFELVAPWDCLESVTGDIRDEAAVRDVLAGAEPEIVLHLAAQSLVRHSYADPVGTFETNILGTVRLLQTIREVPSVRTVVVVTSDKVYENTDTGRPFVETDALGGTDPYSASKAAQELITRSYASSFLSEKDVRVGTCRAGNVVGGGDWAPDRLVPDFFRAHFSGTALDIRYPRATRPWQHVLEPLRGYLMYAEHLHADQSVPHSLNFGPDERALSVAEVVSRLAAVCGSTEEIRRQPSDSWTEHHALQLDSSAASKALGWRPTLTVDQTLTMTASWYREHALGGDMRKFSTAQIEQYMEAIT